MIDRHNYGPKIFNPVGNTASLQADLIQHLCAFFQPKIDADVAEKHCEDASSGATIYEQIKNMMQKPD